MPKENKSSSRRGRRQCLEENDERSSPCLRDLVKTPLGSKRYSPFQRDSTRRDSRDSREFNELREPADIKSRRDSRDSQELRERKDKRDSKDSKELQIRDSRDFAEPSTEKESMTVTLHKNNSIIGNGIKYIMFPLHLLHLCIFGTSTSAISTEKQAETRSGSIQEEKKRETEKEDDKEKKEDKDDRKSRNDRSETPERKSLPREKSPRNEESRKKTDRRSKSPLEELKLKQETISEDDDSSDEMVTAPEDSDSSSDHWCSANDSMLMNMSVEYDHNLEKSMSLALEEPMDVSMDEHFEKLLPSTKGAKEERRSRKDEKRTASSRGNRDGQESSSRFRSVDEDIATIFQKQCTSSEDESPVVVSPVASRAAVTRNGRENKTSCRPENRDLSAGFRTKKTVCDNNNNSCSDDRKKTTDEYEMNKWRRTSRENDVSQRRTERRNEEIIEEKYRSRQDTPSKRRSRSSRTPSKAKDSTKRMEVKCREIGIQTDSAFSDEEDVEMTPLELKATEIFCPKSRRRLHTGSPQLEDMDQNLDYIADNEDSNDGYMKFARKRISSGSTSSSSTDLGFDERGSMMTDADYRSSRCKLESEDHSALRNRMPIARAPPGFPEQPQHPPLTSSCINKDPNYLSTQSVTTLDKRSGHLLGSSVPRPPTPMRHMYYNYPEFMDLPENVGSSKILWNIIRNNYR